MSLVDQQYGQLSQAIVDYGYEYTTKNRPETLCKQITSATLQLPLKDEFPLLTTKKMFTKAIVGELIWFLRGDTNIKYLVDNDINIWNKDAYNYYFKKAGKNACLTLEEFKKSNLSFTGDLGRIYGSQWRRWNGFNNGINTWDEGNHFQTDQISNLIKGLKETPMGTKHIVTAWNPAELDHMALPPCHWAFEILPRPLSKADQIHYMIGDDKIYMDGLYQAAYEQGDAVAMTELDKQLSQFPKYGFTLKWHQRSVDTFLGLPFNIASYGLLAHIIGRMVNMIPLEIIGDLSNVHFYAPHLPVVKEQLTRNPNTYKGCQLQFTSEGEQKFQQFDEDNDVDKLFQSLEIEDFVFANYQSYDKLTAEMFAQTN